MKAQLSIRLADGHQIEREIDSGDAAAIEDAVRAGGVIELPPATLVTTTSTPAQVHVDVQTTRRELIFTAAVASLTVTTSTTGPKGSFR